MSDVDPKEPERTLSGTAFIVWVLTGAVIFGVGIYVVAIWIVSGGD